MEPLPRFDPLCAQQYVVGHTYTLAPIARSREAHNHFFACVQRGFDNLPDEIREKLPTAEVLRKWALIKTGFRHEKTIVAANEMQAAAIAAWAKDGDSYCVVVVHGCAVTSYWAKSQAELAMDRREFSESKRAVLEAISELIGVDVTSLKKAEEA
jgi:hypothetical protein